MMVAPGSSFQAPYPSYPGRRLPEPVSPMLPGTQMQPPAFWPKSTHPTTGKMPRYTSAALPSAWPNAAYPVPSGMPTTTSAWTSAPSLSPGSQVISPTLPWPRTQAPQAGWNSTPPAPTPVLTWAPVWRPQPGASNAWTTPAQTPNQPKPSAPSKDRPAEAVPPPQRTGPTSHTARTESPAQTPAQQTGQQVGQWITRILEDNPQLQQQLDQLNLDEMANQLKTAIQQSSVFKALPAQAERQLIAKLDPQFQPYAEQVLQWLRTPAAPTTATDTTAPTSRRKRSKQQGDAATPGESSSSGLWGWAKELTLRQIFKFFF